MDEQSNERGFIHRVAEGCHLKLKDLKQMARSPRNRYLSTNVRPYPQPEFHVSHLKHDTDRAGLWGIQRKKGFMNPHSGTLLWWSLVVGPEEIKSAEKRLLETIYPERTEEQVLRQPRFLEKFATSPAFLRSSRLGSYRFTLSLEEVLRAYSEQFCSGAEPVMRVLRTDLYKQEVMYAVLVHSPANQKLFECYPLLTDVVDPICSYKDGCFLWRSEAMCETHSYELVWRDDEKQMDVKTLPYELHYVWDHVAVALHVDDQVLNFDKNWLRERLTFCEKGHPVISKCPFDNITSAGMFVKRLWPDNMLPLRRDGM